MHLNAYHKHTAAWLLIVAVFSALLWLLAPVLTPFLVAAVLAYALNPLVNSVQERSAGKVPRWLAVLLVQLLFMLLATSLVMLIVPVVMKEAPVLRAQIPALLDQASAWFQALLLRLDIHVDLSKSGLRDMVLQYLNSDDNTSASIASLLSSIRIGGSLALAIAGNLTLIPLALFYLLLDWNRFTQTLYSLVPRRWLDDVRSFITESDEVLGQYLRGQLLVMAILALYYSVGLALFGLDLAVPIGVFTGLAVFVPYLGFGLGLILALVLGVLKLGLVKAAVMVAIVYGLGQVLESFYLTPRLVGERIGLHPLVVVFALLAFGQLFGFVGVLVALPCSAVLLVAIRRLRQQYMQSALYRNG